MKKKIILLGAACLMAAAFLPVAAQEDTMKTLPPVVIFTKTNVTKAVEQSFQREFKGAIEPQWYRLNKNYLVTFIHDEMKNNALFKKNGRLIYNIRYGHEQNLPGEVRKQLQESYGDYNITNAVNVRENNRNIWVINLEGLKKLVLVRVEEGEMEEVGNFTKSS
jgi:hypothetical protein